jgi:hypothetical protein
MHSNGFSVTFVRKSYLLRYKVNNSASGVVKFESHINNMMQFSEIPRAR